MPKLKRGTPFWCMVRQASRMLSTMPNAQYERGQSRQTVFAYYAGSPELAKRIESGAPADLFISADLDWMDYLEDRKLIKPETRTNLLGNKLVLIAPKESNLSLTI